ncbi:MAG TPA: FKBP-type peptidyl-prolyl cis-trans isomerase [Acidobacteriaceae bacterium]|jgi:peptidylprolyl isomerase|nr:FKBP-type peptidyl-prolyl cis-trans isomerase [Acidobacteriaceae bacterium]
MKRIALLFALAASVAAAQTPAKPATTAKSSTAAKPGTAATRTASTRAATGPKLPPGVPAGRGLVKTAFALRYQDIKVGTGALSEPGKLYHVQYTGWLASDGTKFDSSYDHVAPEMDKDGKPVMGPDGKPKMGEPQPFVFPQGRGRLIPGWDQGFEGMHIGGKRRLFIPYQLAYGAMGRPPKIPAKSDLIFDIELLDITEMPAQPQQPGGMRMMPQRPAGAPGASTPGAPPTPAAAPKPLNPASPSAPSTPQAPASAPSTATPPPTTPPATPQPAEKPTNPAQPQ